MRQKRKNASEKENVSQEYDLSKKMLRKKE